jgi:hypothetical protein
MPPEILNFWFSMYTCKLIQNPTIFDRVISAQGEIKMKQRQKPYVHLSIHGNWHYVARATSIVHADKLETIIYVKKYKIMMNEIMTMCNNVQEEGICNIRCNQRNDI